MHISKASVSRLLKKATEVGIVRTVVVTPDGVYADLEERVEQAFDLQDADSAPSGGGRRPRQVRRDPGRLVNVLITDQHTAQQLAEESPADQEPAVR